MRAWNDLLAVTHNNIRFPLKASQPHKKLKPYALNNYHFKSFNFKDLNLLGTQAKVTNRSLDPHCHFLGLCSFGLCLLMGLLYLCDTRSVPQTLRLRGNIQLQHPTLASSLLFLQWKSNLVFVFIYFYLYIC
jgi:hypothetical protein